MISVEEECKNCDGYNPTCQQYISYLQALHYNEGWIKIENNKFSLQVLIDTALQEFAKNYCQAQIQEKRKYIDDYTSRLLFDFCYSNPSIDFRECFSWYLRESRNISWDEYIAEQNLQLELVH